jgi:hypothetical protein
MAENHTYIYYREVSWREMQIVYSHIAITTCLKFCRHEGYLAEKMFGYDTILILLVRRSTAQIQLETFSPQ